MPVFRTRAGRCAAIHLKEAQIDELRNQYAKNDDGEWIVDDIEVDRRGILLRRAGPGALVYRPHPENAWAAFWAALGVADDAKLRGDDAGLLIAVFARWDENRRAYALIEDARAGKADLRAKLIEQPDLQDHPAMLREVMEMYIAGGLPKGRPGRRANPDPGALELYAWANWYYVHENLSLDEACMRAVERHLHHVPDSWRCEPAETLRRYVERYDALPGHTMKKYRQQKTSGQNSAG